MFIEVGKNRERDRQTDRILKTEKDKRKNKINIDSQSSEARGKASLGQTAV